MEEREDAAPAEGDAAEAAPGEAAPAQGDAARPEADAPATGEALEAAPAAPDGSEAPAAPSAEPPAPPPPARRRHGHPGRRAAIRDRWVLRALFLTTPVLLFVLIDLARRGRSMVTMWRPGHGFSYVGFALLSTCLWGGLLLAASRRRGPLRHAAAALFVAGYAWLFGAQQAFWTRFHIFQSRDSMEHVESLATTLTGTVPLRSLALHVAAFAAAALAFVVAGRRVLRARPRLARAAMGPAVVATVLALFIPVSYREYQATTADLLYLSGLSTRRRILADPKRYVFLQKRTPFALPRLQPNPPARRNVLLFLQESQRFDATCVAYEPDCKAATRATNALLPGRIPLLETRALGSSTLVSMQAIFMGLLPTASREKVHRAPLLWEYARAAGYHTAYYTSQNFMFANLHLWVDGFEGPLVFATHVEPCSNLWCGPPDAQLADRVEAELGALEEPFLLVVHSGNIHTPRVHDPSQAPFQPAADDKTKHPEYDNHYKNVVYLSDVAMGRIVEAVRKTDKGARTVIVYTSDHGESLGDHKQGCEHGCTMFEEEIKVPLFVDAPKGTLSADEERSLRALRKVPVTHADLLPTLLDLLGVWDAPEIQEPRSWMVGHPLTRRTRTTQALPVSNVAWSWNYSAPSWGVLHGMRKTHVTKGAKGYSCYDVAKDPTEQHPLKGGCPDLERVAKEAYGGLIPRTFKNLRLSPEWGER